MAATREVEIEAPPEDVWEALATEEGRGRWLEDEEVNDVEVLDEDAPNRLVWRWAREEQRPTVVEFRIEPVPDGSRVIVTETEPSLPLAMLASSLVAVAA